MCVTLCVSTCEWHSGDWRWGGSQGKSVFCFSWRRGAEWLDPELWPEGGGGESTASHPLEKMEVEELCCQNPPWSLPARPASCECGHMTTQ